MRRNRASVHVRGAWAGRGSTDIQVHQFRHVKRAAHSAGVSRTSASVLGEGTQLHGRNGRITRQKGKDSMSAIRTLMQTGVKVGDWQEAATSGGHTPVPWKLATKRQNGVRTVMMPTGTPDLNIRIADVLEDSHAAFIVQAVNSHDALVEALHECRIALTFYRKWMHAHTVKTPDEEPGTNYPFGDECEHKARLVLEKAGVME
jgi:hypothetical protein